jgi:multidrug efflux pump subunit AcrB
VGCSTRVTTALESKNLAPQDVVNAFNAQNFMLPSGTAKIGETEYSIALNTNPNRYTTATSHSKTSSG